ncbi:hypothetical protein Cni_G21419 [Canna indica]|uniref:Uncharacterized protein n=1 Tax=Canna indica TaxID=4628 RepID=A0AAQ3KS21_9LILI|nr:hypothetical protein Cni_G21419 [Canna indica]
MEDSGAILREISSFKDMLDQVNEEIEQNIQRTREIESEIVKLSEAEDSYAMRECELAKMITNRGVELHALIQVADVAKAYIKLMESDLKSLKMNGDSIEKIISDKREEFIIQCGEFQDEMKTEENDELSLLLLEKAALENEKHNANKKITALENSTQELIEEILQEIHKSNAALEAEIRDRKSKHMVVLDDIRDLQILLESISSFEDACQ